MRLEPTSEPLLGRARAGDELAFRELTDPFRRELELHCYRILGSLQDAEDMLQETLLAAWRGLDKFEARASLRTWLYRIATNRCLNLLRSKARRPAEEVPPMPEPSPPTRRSETHWLQPYPDVLLEGLPDTAPGPAARYETKEATALAFVAGLQRLPPPQRTALVLRDVLGFSARESRRSWKQQKRPSKGRSNAHALRSRSDQSTPRVRRPPTQRRNASSSAASLKRSSAETRKPWSPYSPTTPG
jgi:RNA polymerase sigma-70 factor (TIGR02960 family)